MTLIEILVVIALIALLAGGTVMGFGAVSRAGLRGAAMRVVAASRFAYSRAVSHGTTVRLLFDLDKNTMAIEEAEGRVSLLGGEGAEAPDRDDSFAGERAGAVDPWEAAKAKMTTLIRPTLGRSPFGPITGREGKALKRYEAAPLGKKIRVLRVYVPHAPAPIDAGHAAIYYFPQGQTERAVVQLTDAKDRVYSVAIEPLTGRARVYDYAYEPIPLEDRRSELRDPG